MAEGVCVHVNVYTYVYACMCLCKHGLLYILVIDLVQVPACVALAMHTSECGTPLAGNNGLGNYVLVGWLVMWLSGSLVY